MHIKLRAYIQLDEKNDHLLQIYKSWVFKCVAVAVAVVVFVAVSVAPASAANKTFIFKCVKCLRNIIMILFHIFTLNSGSGNGNGHTFKDPAKVFIFSATCLLSLTSFGWSVSPGTSWSSTGSETYSSQTSEANYRKIIFIFSILIILFEKNNLLVILENLKTSLFIKEVSFVKFTVG